MRYLLDTSVYSQPLKKRPLQSVITKWNTIGDLECCVSVFCELEILQGLKMSESPKILQLYEKVLKNRIRILPFTLEEASIYAGLQADSIKTGRTKPVIDLCIAATAIKFNLILATLNIKDFNAIQGLQVESWDQSFTID